jgi:putative phosphoesterase
VKDTAEALLGVISDTHGLLRPEAVGALEGVDHIIHAGDIGGADILETLSRIAPVSAVRGNMDGGAWTRDLPVTDVVQVAEATLYVLHDLFDLDLSPNGAGFSAVVTGHTHMPEIRWERGVLFLNPGSAGPIRGSKPVSLALVEIEGRRLAPRIVQLL